jgi:hypothetical protein
MPKPLAGRLEQAIYPGASAFLSFPLLSFFAPFDA